MEKTETKNKENIMREIKIDSVTLHCSTADPQKIEKCIKLLKIITGVTPIKTVAKKRIPTFKIRPGLEIGCKVTLRKEKAIEVLKKILVGVPSLKKRQFGEGIFAFGIKEYIEIPSIPYQRDIGIIGFEVMVTLARRGYRVSKRKLKTSKVGTKHRITKEETIDFFTKNFKTPIEEE